MGNLCSGDAQTSGQICLRFVRASIKEVFENKRLFYRIDERQGRLSWGHICLGVYVFNGRYEKLAPVQPRKVYPEGQIKKVRESFGRGEPATFRHPQNVWVALLFMAYATDILQSRSSGCYFCGSTEDVERGIRQHNDPEYT
ncbi:MAG TPA: hypothetical protein PKO23_01810 [Candidatus Hydrogenedentes bacterium]|nr:hypothetical protein [Candidatus Hydrogenedentota bacterium]